MEKTFLALILSLSLSSFPLQFPAQSKPSAHPPAYRISGGLLQRLEVQLLVVDLDVGGVLPVVFDTLRLREVLLLQHRWAVVANFEVLRRPGGRRIGRLKDVLCDRQGGVIYIESSMLGLCSKNLKFKIFTKTRRVLIEFMNWNSPVSARIFIKYFFQ